MDNLSKKQVRPSRVIRSLTRGSRLMLGGGLAMGAGFALVTGVSAAATGSSSSGPSATAPVQGRGPGGPLRDGGPAALGGPGSPIGPGGAGTITDIAGSTLTLRTEDGTETVETSSSTTYRKERQAVAFTSLHVGDVVRITAKPPTTGGSTKSSTPPQPGTGTVDAVEVTIVEPSFAGRVSSIASGRYTLVGRDGQLLTVTTTGSTRYYDGTAQTSASSVSVGSRVVAEGTRSSLVDLSADVVSVAPPPPTPPAGAPSASPPPVAGNPTSSPPPVPSPPVSSTGS